jgi:hypothetical protein
VHLEVETTTTRRARRPAESKIDEQELTEETEKCIKLDSSLRSLC